MIPLSIATKQSRIFILRGAHCVALCALIALAAVLVVAASAVAEQGFALIGTWQQTDKSGVLTVSFNANGTFQSRLCWPPGPGGTGSGCAQWQGTYRATGASSWSAVVRSFRNCASGGGCNSCPKSRGDLPTPGNYGCDIAKSLFGITVGTRINQSLQMQGPNQGVNQNGQTWRRIR
jgi:hypothetical protein